MTRPPENVVGVIARRLLATLAAVLLLLPVLGSPAFSAPAPVTDTVHGTWALPS